MYDFAFADGREFDLIGTDGGLLEAPVASTGIPLSPGERAEIVVSLAPGERIALRSAAPDPALHAGSAEFDVLELRAAASLAPSPDVPAHLADVPAPEATGAVAERTFVMSGHNINDAQMDLGRDYVVATIHRAENTDDAGRLEAIMEALGAVSRDTPVVLPLHPRTRARLAQAGIEPPTELILTDPLGYLDLTALVIGARLVATDSGGLQKEAFFHGVPCVTLREETEWVELVELGWNRLLSPISAASIAAGLGAALGAPLPEKPALSPYGDGHSARKIVERLLQRS
jgi:hypothetical protein